MPITIQGTEYALPGEAGLDDFTGDELDEVERQFSVDALALLGPEPFDASQGLTKSRWLYAMGWAAVKRAGDKRSLADFMAVPVTSIKLPTVPENPTEAASLAAE